MIDTFIVYLITGIIVFAFHQFYIRVVENIGEAGRTVGSWEHGLDTDAESRWQKSLVAVLAATLVLLFWPFIYFFELKRRMFSTGLPQSENKPFKVNKTDLVQKVDIDLIESNEMFDDPLKAVPDLPFGHLNSTWLKFKNRLNQDDQVWYFSASYTDEFGGTEIRKGLAGVSPIEINPYYFRMNRKPSYLKIS